MKLRKIGENKFKYGYRKLTSIFTTSSSCSNCVLRDECDGDNELGISCEDVVGRGILIDLDETLIYKKRIKELKIALSNLINVASESVENTDSYYEAIDVLNKDEL